MKKEKENKKTFSWMNPKLEVRNTQKYGKGVFVKKDIKKDEILNVFGGYVMTVAEAEKLPNKIKDESMQLDNKFCLGIKKENELENSSYFNHSCSPNAGFNGQIFLVAMRDIKKGEQVTFDYAMVLSKVADVPYYKIKCKCGSGNCRKYITEEDWKITKIQKKYNGYFQYYLQKIIDNK